MIWTVWLVTLENYKQQCHEDLFTNLLVAADGGNSKVRNLLGFGNWGWKYEQNAIVATVKLDMDELSMGDEAEETIDFLSGRLCKTWQRFLPTGPVAILPLWDGMASIVWSNTIENTKMLKECTKEEFVLKLNEAFQENNIGSDEIKSITIVPDRIKIAVMLFLNSTIIKYNYLKIINLSERNIIIYIWFNLKKEKFDN